MDILEDLDNFFKSQHSALRKEVGWVVSNICAGTPEQKRLIYASPILKSLARTIQDDELEVS
jgi:hypothetical protein